MRRERTVGEMERRTIGSVHIQGFSQVFVTETLRELSFAASVCQHVGNAGRKDRVGERGLPET